jgi:hypothetical protein
MRAHVEALPPALERAGEPRWRQAVARSVHDRRDVRDVDKRAGAPTARPPYDHAGLVVAGSAWLAFYIIVAIHGLIASGY